MRKLLFLALAAVALSSCFKNNDEEPDPTARGYLMMTGIVNQSVVVADPFNVAFRLNALILAGEGDYASAPDSIKKKLLGELTVISKTTEGVYTLTFNGTTGDNDYMRQGNLIISTNNKSLSDPATTWDITLSEDSKYVISKGAAVITVKGGSYNIACNRTNSWIVTTADFVSLTGSAAESKWSGTLLFEQAGTGGQTIEDMKNTIYSMSITAANAETMYFTDKFNVETVRPLQFNPLCGKGSLVGDAELRIWIVTSDTQNPLQDYTVATWLGENTRECDPPIKIRYNGNEKIYE